MDDAPAASAYGVRVRRAADLGVVAAVAVAMTLTIAVAQEEDATRSPDVLAYLLGLGVAALLLARRQWPMGVLIGSVGLLWIYYGRDYPAFSPAVPLAAATYFAAVAGHARAAAVVVVGVLLVGVGWQIVGEDTSLASVLGTHLLTDGALLTAVFMLAEAVRSRRAWADEVRGRVQREERLRIARDLHDVISHAVSAMSVQATVAAHSIDDSPEQAKAALEAIREQSRRATAELKATVGALRAEPAPGLRSIEQLVGAASGAGVAVDVSVTGEARTLPDAVDQAAYRIVQESLTNVVRHANATWARLLVRYEPNAVVLQVDDNGSGGAVNGAGHGLAGMRERAAALGGMLEAGPAPAGGFRVYAELPT
jgi:signal transduction histidine kinase